MSMRSVILREREIVMAQYSRQDDLPAWVQFPDIERIEWVNKVGDRNQGSESRKTLIRILIRYPR